VEILAVQLSKREAELLQQKDEVTKLAKSLKQVCLLLHNLSKCDDQYFQNLVLILLDLQFLLLYCLFVRVFLLLFIHPFLFFISVLFPFLLFSVWFFIALRFPPSFSPLFCLCFLAHVVSFLA
jgi:hypothetical protein